MRHSSQLLSSSKFFHPPLFLEKKRTTKNKKNESPRDQCLVNLPTNGLIEGKKGIKSNVNN